jgi:predicted polyphosphate/ATP-dependent NAD kinase
MNSVKKRLGLIINPIAGIGGRVGLKGSDGITIQKQAFALGALPQARERSIQSFELLAPIKEEFELITYPGEMGAEAARACGFEPNVIGSIRPGKTTAQDTIDAAKEMVQSGVDLILFAGGDGTARDIYNAIGDQVPVLGIPTGVKIHSAVFGTNPRNVGELARLFIRGKARRFREAEVIDIDEEALRQDIASVKLYGYLRVPFQKRLLQGLKTPSHGGEEESLAAIAYDVIEKMENDSLYIFGPGTTTRAIVSELGLKKTLTGVDVLLNGKMVGIDVNESQLLEFLMQREAKIIITPIGGQGFLFGRGNQQFSPNVIRKVGRDSIIVVATPEKIHSLRGRPLLVDTGDPAVDDLLCGYMKVVTGSREQIVYKVST